jgi:endonuclease YncB( thermonuclease family)
MIYVMRMNVLMLSTFLLCIQLISPDTSSAMGDTPPSQPVESEIAQCDFQKVSRVIDGDTFVVSSGEKIRLIGVDTPETIDPRKAMEWFGREASPKLKVWIEKETVCLQEDVNKTQETDKYGRLLRYVWKYPANDEGIYDHPASGAFFVNAELIKQGYGFAYTRFPFQFMENFRAYEKYARANNRGLWDREKQALWERIITVNRARAATCGKTGTLCPENALNHTGKQKTVRFFVEKSYDSGKAVFLNSKRDFKDPDNFTAVIFRANKHRFPPLPADLYWGKAIDVSGTIKLYDSRAEIILKSASQITIIQ